LPDGLFSDQKSQLRFTFVGLGMENLGTFYCHFGTFKSIWHILWQFGTFFPLWYVTKRKIWQPCSKGRSVAHFSAFSVFFVA
jgi:hypothetical protein